jgi:hypothetical protein
MQEFMQEALSNCGWEKGWCQLISPEMDELVFTTTGSEMHRKFKSWQAVDDKITSAKADDDQRDERMVVSGWWMGQGWLQQWISHLS